MSRSFRELVHADDAIGLIADWVGKAPHHVELLPCPPEAGQRTLEALGVTTRSPMGAMAFHTGGLLIDHGWLRVMGAGCDRFPRALDTWNNPGERRLERGFLVGDDVLGGFFAWFHQPRSIHYYAPDTMEWEDLGLGYGDWLETMLSERLNGFYATLRWHQWEGEVRGLSSDQALLVYPPLIVKTDETRSRRPVPLEELWRLTATMGQAHNPKAPR